MDKTIKDKDDTLEILEFTVESKNSEIEQLKAKSNVEVKIKNAEDSDSQKASTSAQKFENSDQFFNCDICDFKTNSVDNLSEHKHKQHQHKCVYCEFETQNKDTFDAHRKDNHIYSCDKCLLTLKDDWKHQIHICKVDITNPTFGDFYTKEWLDHNGCNAIYSL